MFRKQINVFILKVTLLTFTFFSYSIGSKAQLIYGVEIIPDRLETALRKDLSNATNDRDKLAVLLKLGNLYLNKRYPKSKSLEQALYFSRQARSLGHKVHSDQAINEAQLLMALTFMRQENMDSTIRIYKNVNDTTRFNIALSLSIMYRFRGLNANDVGLGQKAMDYALLAKRISDTLGIPEKKILAEKAIVCIRSDTEPIAMIPEMVGIIKKLQAVNYKNLHYTYFELVGSEEAIGNSDKALYYSLETLKSMGQTGDSSLAGDFLWGYSVMLGRVSRHEESIKYAKLAIDQFKHKYGTVGITNAVEELIDEMNKLKMINEAESYLSDIEKAYPPETLNDSIEWTDALGKFYRIAKKYPVAENYLLQELTLRKRTGQLNFDTYHSLGQLYVESKNFSKGKIYLTKALALVDSTVPFRALGHLHYCLFLADSATGDYLSAIKHLDKNKLYDDTILTRSKTEAIQKYLTQFETLKKEDSLKQQAQHISLLQQRNELQQINLEQADLIKNISIVGTTLILIVLILLYYQFRKNQRSNKIILQKNEELKDMLAEKEWWLKEVHHRVKNNLHTIICLLESQAMYLEKDALQAIEKSQHRIYAMSLIHQKLYQNEDLQVIDMSMYLEEFIGYLKDSFDTEKIDFIIQVDPVQLNLQQAIPVALIINETVTNAIKYAFEYANEPKIYISMNEKNERVKLIITDNGKGFELKEESEGKSLGIQLIKGLSKELKGTVSIDTKEGTTLRVEFKRGPLKDQMVYVKNDTVNNES